MKKILALLLCISMVFSFAGCSQTPEAPVTEEKETTIEEQTKTSEISFEPGTYEGKANGFGGPIKVKVVVDETSIKSIEVTEQTETLGIGTTAIEHIPEAVVEAQSLGVDIISGATFSSFGTKAAISSALEKSGVDMTMISKSPEKQELVKKDTETIETDIVVVGAGGSGLAAALSARQNGADVVLLEKMAFMGGAMSISGGGVLATESNYQEEQGYGDDTAKLLYEDLLRGGHDLNHKEIVELYSENVGETFDWIKDEIGVEFSDIYPMKEYVVPRQANPIGNAPGMAEVLRKEVKESGAKIYLEIRANKLIEENGKVTGVIAESKDGQVYEIKADAVVLATGGFGNNKELLPDSLKSILYYGPVSSTGDGIVMAKEVGAMTHLMDLGKIYPNGVEAAPGFAKSTVFASMDVMQRMSGILVDRSGNRVVDESGAFAGIKNVLLEQPDQTLFVVLDQENWDAFNARNKAENIYTDAEVEDWLDNNGSKNPVFVKNDDLRSAAEAAGIDGEALVNTVERYNTFVENGKDEDFGRASLPMSIGEGPYYIVEQKPRFATTLGGLKISTNFEVYNESEQPIEGLYAIGEVVGGVHGDDSMPAANIGWAFTSGRLLGKQLAEMVK